MQKIPTVSKHSEKMNQVLSYINFFYKHYCTNWLDENVIHSNRRFEDFCPSSDFSPNVFVTKRNLVIMNKMIQCVCQI